MPERAQVRSVEAIAAFRASLIVFLTKARALLDEVTDEKQRTRVWLENDRRAYWEAEYRRCTLRLQEAQQGLFSAKLSRIQTTTAAQVLAVERAQRAVRAAETKRAAVRRWTREFENRAEPLARQIEQLQGYLSTELAKGVVELAETLAALERYGSSGASGTADATPSTAGLPPETGAPGATETPANSELEQEKAS